MFSKPSVLIVDESAETREVLRTALARRGTEIWEATRAEEGLELARRHHPSVIVLDLEIADQASDAIQAGFGAAETAQTPIVLLGSARRGTQTFPTGQFVVKPYHYGPLVRKIESLLDEVRRPLAEDA
ncbi:MAG: response regulator [Planctomycetia bacterium]|nr:response regulator [Planctomycetia bacterium]